MSLSKKKLLINLWRIILNKLTQFIYHTGYFANNIWYIYFNNKTTFFKKQSTIELLHLLKGILLTSAKKSTELLQYSMDSLINNDVKKRSFGIPKFRISQ